MIGFPVGEDNFGLRGQGVDDLAAENAMLAVASLEIVIDAEGTDGDAFRQDLSKLLVITAKAAVQNGDGDAPAAIARPVPALDAEAGKMPCLLGGRRGADLGPAFRRRFLGARRAPPKEGVGRPADVPYIGKNGQDQEQSGISRMRKNFAREGSAMGVNLSRKAGSFTAKIGNPAASAKGIVAPPPPKPRFCP